MLSQKIMALRLFDFQIQNMIDTNLIEITLKKIATASWKSVMNARN